MACNCSSAKQITLYTLYKLTLPHLVMHVYIETMCVSQKDIITLVKYIVGNPSESLLLWMHHSAA